MQIFKYLKNIKSFSVIVLPDDTSYAAKSRKLKLLNTIIILVLYSIVCSIIGYYILQLTGIGHIILPGQTKMSKEDTEKIETLNEKIIFLAKELQSLKSTNERLKYALILGDSSITDSIFMFDTTKKSKIPSIDGNIVAVFLNLFESLDIFKPDDIIFIKPIDGFISRKFAPEKGHQGIDIVVKEGTSVFASAGGFVIFADYTIDFGYTIILGHSEGYITIYKHCSSLLKNQRELVLQGELIALSGNSGYQSTGPHLHFEIWKDGVAINPESILINY